MQQFRRQDRTADAAPRETSAITSRLLLLYLERVGGRAAVDAVLEHCGLREREADLRDQNHWFSYADKIRLFHAASEVMNDPKVMLHVGEKALVLNVGDGLKVALRALGSPRLDYQNIVRANAKFTGSHAMELLAIGSDHAVIRYRDLGPERRYDPLDCQYNQGMLACVPELFGLPRARVSHPLCGCAGSGEGCVYELRWDGSANAIRFALGAAATGAGAVAATALAAPALVPAGIAVAGGALAAAAARAGLRLRARWRVLESELRERSQVAERLTQSLHDLASELRLEDVLAKVTRNAQLALGGKEFALLIDEGAGPRCKGSTGLPELAVRALEAWASDAAGLDGSLTVEDTSLVPALAALNEDGRARFGSICAAPLLFRGERHGLLIALATQARSFLPRDLDVIQSYATQAAIALANARLYKQLEELAIRDHLTGLLNHREFHLALDREIERCRRYGGGFAVILFDLDDFKTVNDSRGHLEGDRVLRQAARALAGSCRASDLPFRIGGDEFAYIAPECDRSDAAALADRARRAIAREGLGLGVSYGVAVFGEDAEEKDVLLGLADADLYRGKRAPAAERAVPEIRPPE